MQLVLIGSPGAGKGTQADYLVQSMSIPQLSTGNILRTAIEAGSSHGKAVKILMNNGELVPDDIMISLIRERLARQDCANGFLLDGFPRTVAQAVALKKCGTKLDAIIDIHVEDHEIVKRMSGRRVHLPSGRTYHTEFNPPKNSCLDDLTGEKLIQREDDQEETVRRRLQVFHDQTTPVIEYYQTWAESNDNSAPVYIKVSGMGSVLDIRDDIHTQLQSYFQTHDLPVGRYSNTHADACESAMNKLQSTNNLGAEK